ncbi:uncharacterized protein LOC128731604 [Anopheles nili]|uniref:uncharacterized protein LOC128731604 n=1 Tax=Anopheles nili TaxID=185578 RepID=UPI00237B46FE|nr:uncharacterized protein LOC128731604 [Anopheles nili]
MGALAALILVILARKAIASTMDVYVNQENAQVYHRQDMKRGEFDYGYHVQAVNNQFQHKVKGPDDVTYGCYGYVDPAGRKHLVYYVADRMGYRIIFPNRATKIFTAKLTDSLNKLDGSVKGKDYDEKVVEWNNLYMPESCFRLHEILDTAASSQVPAQAVPAQQPAASSQVPVKTVAPPRPELPKPTQYTIPTTPPAWRDQTRTGTNDNEQFVGEGEYRRPQPSNTGINVQAPGSQDQGSYHEQGQQPVQPVWQGSLPDINPANINLDQFSGTVYPIHTGAYETHQEGSNVASATVGQFATTQHSLNITQLLSQIEAVNSQVVTLNMLLAGMAANPTAFANANESSCRSVVQLLSTQKRTPQLVYVPILIPYVEGQHNVNQPIAGLKQAPVHGGCHNCRG